MCDKSTFLLFFLECNEWLKVFHLDHVALACQFLLASVLIFSLLFFPASREKCYKQIQAAIAKFREIKENINEGLKFYVTLQVRNVWLDCAVQVFI